MNETAQNRLIKYVFLIAAFVLCVFALFVRPSFAQSASPASTVEPSVKNEEIKYPIEDLGNCADIGTCMRYCDDTVNNVKCIGYAKEKGFYRDDKVNSADEK